MGSEDILATRSKVSHHLKKVLLSSETFESFEPQTDLIYLFRIGYETRQQLRQIVPLCHQLA